jgi:hypothetical protein
MTKKDYDLIAACLGGAYARNIVSTTFSPQQIATSAIDDIKRRLMLELELDNPRFDGAKFSAAVDKWTAAHGGA